MAVITLRNLSKSFGKKRVLDNINLEIQKGETVGLVGASGSGKSVLIKILIGFVNQYDGEVFISNQNVDSLGFSMQNNSLYENLTLTQNLNYFSKIYSLPRKLRVERIPKLISWLELEEYKNTLVRNMSGGTKKRLDIACALLKDPSILILDEPFMGLDPLKTSGLAKLISSLNSSGKTILLSSHIVNELSDVCTKIILLKDGKISSIKKSQLKNEVEK